MRAVVDTNVLVRALMNPTGTWGLIASRRAEYRHILSPELIAELLRVVRRPRLKERFGQLGQQRALDRAREIITGAEVVEPAHVPRVSRDEDDDKLFACALEGHADVIVSEDEDFLAVGEYEGIRTVQAAKFLRLLDDANPDRDAIGSI